MVIAVNNRKFIGFIVVFIVLLSDPSGIISIPNFTKLKTGIRIAPLLVI